jgi:outer membrane protein assembly factor BamB
MRSLRLLRRLRAATVLGTACLLFLTLAAPAGAARAGLTLGPAVGPPTSLVKAKGFGFAGGEVVAFFFDAGRVGSELASRSGKFNGRLSVPASARPGEHAVEAVGQSSGVVARATFVVRTDWLQACFGGGRSCFNPVENVIGPANAGALAPAWRAAVASDGSSSPVYANGKLFVGARTGLVGLDPATGAIIINDHSGPVSTTPGVIRGFDPQPDPPGKVIFGSSDGTLHAVDSDGRPLWEVSVGAAPVSPLVPPCFPPDPCKVIVGAGNTLVAFDGNGHRLWATVLEGGDISKAAAMLTAPPEPERIVVPAGNTLYALEVATGGIVWATAPSRSALGAPSIGNPDIIGDPSILVGDAAGTLFALDRGSGAVKATFSARGPIGGAAIGDPNQSEPWVFAGDGGGNIYAIDQTDDFPPPQWTLALGEPVDGPPVLANGVVYLGTDPEIGDPHIFALDQANGRVLFDGPLPGGVSSSPIVADGRLVVATKSGDVLAYQPPDS